MRGREQGMTSLPFPIRNNKKTIKEWNVAKQINLSQHPLNCISRRDDDEGTARLQVSSSILLVSSSIFPVKTSFSSPFNSFSSFHTWVSRAISSRNLFPLSQTIIISSITNGKALQQNCNKQQQPLEATGRRKGKDVLWASHSKDKIAIKENRRRKRGMAWK